MNDTQTHWEGCWHDPRHHACAVAMVVRLREIVKAVVAQHDRRASAASAADDDADPVCGCEWCELARELVT